MGHLYCIFAVDFNENDNEDADAVWKRRLRRREVYLPKGVFLKNENTTH